ncbi:hypothetical protein D3C76_1823450 [compost metagenome]
MLHIRLVFELSDNLANIELPALSIWHSVIHFGIKPAPDRMIQLCFEVSCSNTYTVPFELI